MSELTGTIAITDQDWYEFLREQADLEEVNFWKPSARRKFRAPEFSPFLFKLRAPHNAICGFGFFARYSRLPAWLAWDTFGVANGCATYQEMQERISAIRERIRYEENRSSAFIGCVLIVQPVFFPPEAWVAQPADWPIRTQSDKKYALATGEGMRVWQDCLERAREFAGDFEAQREDLFVERQPRYGEAQLIAPRLGQGTFRIAVTEAYEGACAVTREHSLPVLDAAHIRPYGSGGGHEVRNGLLLRADLHRLFDKGYMTVTPELRVEVSPRLREDFHNGRSYYPMHGEEVQVPAGHGEQPDRELLEWHNENIFAN